MGTFTVHLEVGNLAGQEFVGIEALVDTGSTYTVLPRHVLELLGIESEDNQTFSPADGRLVDYPIGYARTRVEGTERIVLIVFGDEDTEPLLGAATLEHLSFGVDPLNQKLIPIPALLK